jgi:hypothetical protein
MSQIEDFISVKILRKINEDEVSKMWNVLTTDNKIFDGYEAICISCYCECNPSSEDDYRRAIEVSIKSYMDMLMDVKEQTGEEDNRTEEDIRKFFDTPIGNGKLKTGYIIFSLKCEDDEDDNSVRLIELSSKTSMTYGMILYVHTYIERTLHIDQGHVLDAKIGLSEDHFVFELYIDL